MSRDPSVALQDAIYLAIKDLASGRVRYRHQGKPELPYVEFGEDRIEASYDYFDLSECEATIHAFDNDRIKVKELAGAIRQRLDTELTIPGWIVYEYEFVSTDYMTLSDGKTEQATIEVRYLLRPAE